MAKVEKAMTTKPQSTTEPKLEPCGVCKFHWNMIVMPGERHNRNCPYFDGAEKGCACQGCGQRYKVDVMVPDDLWDRIKPEDKADGAGLLCGRCICSRIETLGQFDAFTLSRLSPASAAPVVESPILAFQAWLERWVIDNGRKLTQDEYGIAYAAFIAAHPGEGPKAQVMAAPVVDNCTCLAAGNQVAWEYVHHTNDCPVYKAGEIAKRWLLEHPRLKHSRIFEGAAAWDRETVATLLVQYAAAATAAPVEQSDPSQPHDWVGNGDNCELPGCRLGVLEHLELPEIDFSK